MLVTIFQREGSACCSADPGGRAVWSFKLLGSAAWPEN